MNDPLHRLVSKANDARVHDQQEHFLLLCNSQTLSSFSQMLNPTTPSPCNKEDFWVPDTVGVQIGDYMPKATAATTATTTANKLPLLFDTPLVDSLGA